MWLVVKATLRPLYHRGRDPVPIVQVDGWVPGPVWTVQNSRVRFLIKLFKGVVKSLASFPPFFLFAGKWFLEESRVRWRGRVSKAPRNATLATFLLESKCRGQTDEALATVHVQVTAFPPTYWYLLILSGI